MSIFHYYKTEFNLPKSEYNKHKKCYNLLYKTRSKKILMNLQNLKISKNFRDICSFKIYEIHHVPHYSKKIMEILKKLLNKDKKLRIQWANLLLKKGTNNYNINEYLKILKLSCKNYDLKSGVFYLENGNGTLIGPFPLKNKKFKIKKLSHFNVYESMEYQFPKWGLDSSDSKMST